MLSEQRGVLCLRLPWLSPFYSIELPAPVLKGRQHQQIMMNDLSAILKQQHSIYRDAIAQIHLFSLSGALFHTHL